MTNDQWNQIVLEACRRSWNMPNLTIEELRAKQASKSNADMQFDAERDWDERGITARDAYAEEHPRQSGGERV